MGKTLDSGPYFSFSSVDKTKSTFGNGAKNGLVPNHIRRYQSAFTDKGRYKSRPEMLTERKRRQQDKHTSSNNESVLLLKSITTNSSPERQFSTLKQRGFNVYVWFTLSLLQTLLWR